MFLTRERGGATAPCPEARVLLLHLLKNEFGGHICACSTKIGRSPLHPSFGREEGRSEADVECANSTNGRAKFSM